MAAVLAIAPLPEDSLAASARFHTEFLAKVAAVLADRPETLTLVFKAADHSHRAWRLAAVQQLARHHAPLRINALQGGDDRAIAAGLEYCAAAPGLTGQLLELDGNGASALLNKEL